MAQQVIPTGNRILIKQVAEKETYGDTGIYIPDAQKVKENKGYIVQNGE